MSSMLGFRDHQGFHRAAMWMTVGGVAAGLGVGLAGAGVQGALFAGATGAVLGAGWADRAAGWTRLAARAVLLAGAGGAFLLGNKLGGGHVGVLALAAVLGVALNLGVRGWRAVAAVAVGGGIAYLGGFAAGQIMIARETAPLPDFLEGALASTAMSIVCIAALLPRHLELMRDAVAVAHRALPASLDPEMRELVERGHAVYVSCSPKLDDDGRGLLRDGVLRLHDLASRWSKVDGTPESDEALVTRGADLDARIAAATDDVVREQYREARAAVTDQVRYVESIKQSRERVLARLHSCVATLEKFRLASAHLETQNASRQAADARGAAGMLAEVSADIDACGEAMAELDGQGSGPVVAAADAPAA